MFPSIHAMSGTPATVMLILLMIEVMKLIGDEPWWPMVDLGGSADVVLASKLSSNKSGNRVNSSRKVRIWHLLSVYLSLKPHTCMHTHKHTHTHAHLHTHAHTHMHTHTYTHTHIHTHTHVHTHMHTHMYTHTHAHTHMYTRTHM